MDNSMVLLTLMQTFKLAFKKVGIPQPTLMIAVEDVERLKVVCKKLPEYKYVANYELGDVIVLGGVAITWPQKKKVKPV